MNGPPFLGSVYTMVPQIPEPPSPEDSSSPYNPGPYCGGIDKFICEGLGKIHFGGARGSALDRMGVGTDLDLRQSCKVLANSLCGVTVVTILLVILAVSITNLLL